MLVTRYYVLALGLLFGSVSASSFDDTAWIDLVKKQKQDNVLSHYNKSNDHLPDVDCFPRGFLWGSAVAEFQNSGALAESNWKAHVIAKKLQDLGLACNHWSDYQKDIELMDELGFNSFRFSIDWSVLQPAPGEWNNDAINRYHRMLDMLLDHGITPMATLHHFVHPQWFEDLGGFENEENIQYFVEFAAHVFRHFHTKINLWCTINEPAVYAMTGYVLGIHAPGKGGSIGTAGVVLKNLLKAHVAVYQRFRLIINEKGFYHEGHAIGLVHNFLQFQSRYALDPIGQITASLFTGVSNDPVIKALQTNQFSFDPVRVPHIAIVCAGVGVAGVAFMKQKEKHESVVDWARKHWTIAGGSALAILLSTLYRAKTVLSDTIEGLSESFDFMGLNYYARPIVGLNTMNGFGATCYPDQVMGEMDLPVSDPVGFKQAITAMAGLQKPIIITETGCADATDEKRPLLLRESLRVISDALQQGVDIRGYYHWTLMDNYEWHNGFKPKFGLCTNDRTPRLSAYWLKDFMQQASH